MAVIPQFPILFSGCSVRDNLDPFGEYNDDAIKRALSDVQMIESIKDLPHDLSSIIAEGGSNFSVGQRQLLCLARAILKKSRILILDEPTANVDSWTEKLLQKAVVSSFPGATIIAIAHRLDTIIDFDQILVFGQGEVLEYGSPRDLLALEGGHFSSMIKDTGEQTEKELIKKIGLHKIILT
eukprot:11957641-Ditylum_brightwellii.AAC.1